MIVCICPRFIFLVDPILPIHFYSKLHALHTIILPMASSSTQPRLSETAAKEIAKDWKACVRALVAKDDKQAFAQQQAQLYTELVGTRPVLLITK